MKELFHNTSRARLRIWLTIGYVMFIVYGSLSPFSGWREQGVNFIDVLNAPLMLTYTAFDAVLNLLSYLPFGLLVCLTLRSSFSALTSIILSLCMGIALSASMEYLQMFLPSRNSSNMDLITNSVGTLLGALMAMSVAAWTGLFLRMAQWRSHFFFHGKEMDFGLALLALWMFGQINPSLPMLGNVFISGAQHKPFVTLPNTPFNLWHAGAVSLNLLMLGSLILTLLRVPRNIVTVLLMILSMVAIVKFINAALLLKSWALFLWINSEAVFGMLAGIALMFLIMGLPRKVSIFLGAIAAIFYFYIVNFEFDSNSPSAAMSIYHWHYGHLLNYNGLAQTIMLIFPFLCFFTCGAYEKYNSAPCMH